jgi:hypothetical protein
LPVYATYLFSPSKTTLNITLAIEGYYNLSNSRLNIRDTVTAYLRSSVSPFSAVDSAKSVIDSVSLTGSFEFFNTYSGRYYVSIQGRNILETWSRSGGETVNAGTVNSYDFTTSVSNAFGNNMILKGSKYCIYSGDVNNDGIIDAADVSSADNDAYLYLSGYLDTDVNGDYSVDATDLQIIDNNAFNIISVITP